MERNEKTLAYSSLYFGMGRNDIETALKSDKKIIKPEIVSRPNGEIINNTYWYQATFFYYDYLLNFEYTRNDELSQLIFISESSITENNFGEGITELKKLLSLIEAKYGTPDLKEIGDEIGDYFIAKWNKEKEIMIGIRQNPYDEEFFQVVLAFSYLPLLKEEEEYNRQQETSFIESEIDLF